MYIYIYIIIYIYRYIWAFSFEFTEHCIGRSERSSSEPKPKKGVYARRHEYTYIYIYTYTHLHVYIYIYIDRTGCLYSDHIISYSHQFVVWSRWDPNSLFTPWGTSEEGDPKKGPMENTRCKHHCVCIDSLNLHV